MDYYRLLSQHIFDNYVWGVFKRDFTVEESTTSREESISASAGYGNSLAIMKGGVGYIVRELEDSDSYSFKESISVKILCLNPRKMSDVIFKKFQNEIDKIYGKNKIFIYKSTPSGRQFICNRSKRSMDTIFISDDIKTKIINHLELFFSSENEYSEKGLSWHTGILLSGSPGNGKTSLIHAIASYFEKDIHYHSSGALSSSEYIPENCILVLEDFDVCDFGDTASRKLTKESSKEKEQKDNPKLNQSDVLNFLDGFLTPEGMVVIATTNHINNIDPAIVRSGRFDLNLVIDNVEYKEYARMCAMYDKKPKNQKDYIPTSGADLMIELRDQKIHN